jgi:NAD(P)-dependent dehydrogenase (short-subunit alcohol dehydrogenase family)
VTGRLLGKVAVVTGAAGGIGGAAAQRFADEGASVVALDKVQAAQASGENADASDENSTENMLYLQADVTEESQVAAAFETVREEFGRLDVLYTCAGIQLLDADKQVDNLEMDAWSRTLAVNLTGVYLCCKYAVRMMLERNAGSIINCSSPLAVSGRGWRYHAYSASKGGVHALTKAMAAAYGPRGIRVNAIVPGTVQTAMTAALGVDPARIGELTQRAALRRLARPQDIAGAAVFLASDESSYVTGSTYSVDGGLLIT